MPGATADVAIDVQPVTFTVDVHGIAHATEYLIVSNHGPDAVGRGEVGFCLDNFFPEFDIRGDFVGGCGSGDFGPVCFDGGFGYGIPSIAPGRSYSCELHLDGWDTYREPLGFPLRIGWMDAAPSGYLLDPNPGNDYAYLLLGPPPAVAVPMLQPSALVVLALALALTARYSSHGITARRPRG